MTPSYVRFVILSAARTGSNMLATLLHDHPEIICFRELFNHRASQIDFGVEGYDPGDEADRHLRDTDFSAFLEQRIFREHGPRIQTVGFKMPYEHFMFFPGMEGWIAGHREIHIVHLRRRNLLRQFASVKVAQATGVWVDDRPYSPSRVLRLRYAGRAIRHPMRAATVLKRLIAPRLRRSKSPAWKAERVAVTLPVDECRYYFDWCLSTAASYEASFRDNPVEAVFYEDVANAKEAVLNSLQGFLGVRPQRLVPGTRKQNPEPLSELVANYHELQVAFKGTEYAAFFE